MAITDFSQIGTATLSATSSVTISLEGDKLSAVVNPTGVDHSQLASLNTSNFTHLTSVNHQDLTDGGATTLHKHDHGNMDGLTDDDHVQYHNDARGDLRYSPLSASHTMLHALDSTTDHSIGSLSSSYIPLVSGTKLVNSRIQSTLTNTYINTDLWTYGYGSVTIENKNDPYTYPPYGGIYFGGKYTSANSTYFGAIEYYKQNAVSGNKAGYLVFSTSDTTLTEKMRITSGGSVGIGTSTPNQKFQINDGSIYVRSNTSGTTRGISVATGGDTIWWMSPLITSGSTAGTLAFSKGSTPTENTAMVITASTLNVGIGTTSPITTLDVRGNVFVSGNVSANNPTLSGHLATKYYVDSIPSGISGISISGTSGYIPMFNSTSGITNSVIYQSPFQGGRIGIGTTDLNNATFKVVGDIENGGVVYFNNTRSDGVVDGIIVNIGNTSGSFSEPQYDYVQRWQVHESDIASINAYGQFDFYTSGLAHGITTVLPTDVYGRISDVWTGYGGLKLTGLSVDAGDGASSPIYLQSINTFSVADGLVVINGCNSSGAGVGTTDVTLLNIQNNGVMKFTVGPEGNIYTAGNLQFNGYTPTQVNNGVTLAHARGHSIGSTSDHDVVGYQNGRHLKVDSGSNALIESKISENVYGPCINTGSLSGQLSNGELFAIKTDSQTLYNVNSNGNVGIGVSGITSTDKLHIYSTSDNHIKLTRVDTTTDTATINIGGTATSGTGKNLNISALHDIVLAPNNTELVRISESGYVGIGTTSATVPFQVQKSAASNFVGYFNNTDTGISCNGLLVNIQSNASTSTVQRWRVNGNEVMRINGLGNVGIGITSGSSKLHIVESTSAAHIVTINNTTDSSGCNIYMGYNNNSTRYGVYVEGGGTDSNTSFFRAKNILNVKGDGNVLVGNLSGVGNRSVYSDANGNLTNSSSDERLKINIETLTYGIEDVMKMRPVRYNWREDLQQETKEIDIETINKSTGDKVKSKEMLTIIKKGSQKEIGLIAQEVQTIIPEVVGTNSDGMMSVDYPKLVSVLIGSIQELKREIDLLKSIK